MRKVKLQTTPITDATFERQGWLKHIATDFNDIDDFLDNQNGLESDTDDSEPYFWTLPIPKERTDKYSPRLISNASDDNLELANMKLKPGQYFVEILDFDNLGFCTSEEELEILYKSLTGKYIEE